MRARALLLAAVVAACGGEGTRPGGALAEADSSDMMMFGFVNDGMHNGIRRSRLEADTAFFFESRQMSVMKGVRALFYDENGAQTSSLTAQRMEYNWQDGSMRAEGNVVLNGPEGRRLTSVVLIYNPARNSLSSDRPFVLTRGNERIEGAAFRADADFKNFVATSPRGVAGDSLLLPGQ